MSEPRYATQLGTGRLFCEDCGCLVVVKAAHTRFHSILSSHAWALAVLIGTHDTQSGHDRLDVRERLSRRKFDNWSADALAEVVEQMDRSEQPADPGVDTDTTPGVRGIRAVPTPPSTESVGEKG